MLTALVEVCASEEPENLVLRTLTIQNVLRLFRLDAETKENELDVKKAQAA